MPPIYPRFRLHALRQLNQPMRMLFLAIGLLLNAGLSAQTSLYVTHWTSSSDPNLTAGAAGAVSTFALDTVCSQIGISVLDTTNAPLLPFNAYQIDPVDSAGNQVVDISGKMRLFFRVRSLASVRLAVQLRSGGGGSAERTDRIEYVVPGDTNNWSTFEFVFNATNLAGFDSTNLRDIWFYLDRGVNNFAGNEFYLDYVSIGAMPDSATFSNCIVSTPPTAPSAPLYTLHWSSANDALFSGNAAAVITQTRDTACSQIGISVTNPSGAPLTAFTALILNPLDSAGMELTDLSGNMQVNLRVRSRDTVKVGLLLRSGDGTAPFRSTLQEQVLPGDTASWTEMTFAVNAGNLGGFDSTDLRDVWIYLDRGTDNFRGNEFYFDYLSIGAKPDTALNSSCLTDTTVTVIDTTAEAIQYTVHWTSGSDPVFSGASAATLTQAIDSACSQLMISVTDPVNAPWNGTSPIIVNPLDSAGMDVADLSGAARVHLRVRSRDSVRVGFIARSGDGTTNFRSLLQEQMVPGDTLHWTELTFGFDASIIGGFDSTDLRDLWFFLDRGTDNFSGNAFYLDYVAIGQKPDPAENSPCSLFPAFEFPYVLNWATAQDGVLGGSEAVKLTQVIDTACSQLAISVTDPLGDPYAGFSPMIINPRDNFGNDIVDLSGNMTFYVRVRSKEALNLAMVLRSAGGGTNERTEPVEQPVPGDLSAWTELAFTFTGASYGTFDSTDLRDFWFFLDRGDPNFRGNEFYFDYVSIGSRPDSGTYSTCIDNVGIDDLAQFQSLRVFPNPTARNQALNVEFFAEKQGTFALQVFDLRGQMIFSDQFQRGEGLQEYKLQPGGWASGLYTIQLIGNGKKGLVRWLID